MPTVKVAIGGRKKLQSGGGKKSSASAVTSEWKNLWLGMSLPEMMTNPISTPLSISDLHFFMLEGRKEKLPAYRGTVAPTHFQEQVGWGTWLVQQPHWQLPTHQQTDQNQAGRLRLEPERPGPRLQHQVAVPGQGEHLQGKLKDLQALPDWEVLHHALTAGHGLAQ